MLFLEIDQHARQLTVSLRDQHGDVILARQVSTQPEKILDFFDQLTRSWLYGIGRCCGLLQSGFVEMPPAHVDLTPNPVPGVMRVRVG